MQSWQHDPASASLARCKRDVVAAIKQCELAEKALQQTASEYPYLHETISEILTLLDAGDMYPYLVEGQAFLRLWHHKQVHAPMKGTAASAAVADLEIALVDRFTSRMHLNILALPTLRNTRCERDLRDTFILICKAQLHLTDQVWADKLMSRVLLSYHKTHNDSPDSERP